MESEARQISHKLNVPVINLRFGIIICKESKILQDQLPLLRGSIGTGNQWLSWIHIEDLCNAIVLLLQAISSDMNEIFSLVGGTINMCTPSPVKQKDFARILNEEMHLVKHSKTPMWIIKLLLGKPADVLARSLKVMPVKLSQLGYKFKYLSLQAAVKSQFGNSEVTSNTANAS
jgi:NAD dependent epimerase/dehydratase family enzyme